MPALNNVDICQALNLHVNHKLFKNLWFVLRAEEKTEPNIVQESFTIVDSLIMSSSDLWTPWRVLEPDYV